MKNLLVSFSGGETSAFMAQWIKRHLESRYENTVYVFANTGIENEQTLEFVQQCDDHWKFRVQWVEAAVNFGQRIGTGYWLTDFDNAKRKGEPFEDIIRKYGIPNHASPHCTRELKLAPIRAFAKEWFRGKPYDTAIGIRIDELDRINPTHKERGYVYPLAEEKMIPTTKAMVNFFWNSMHFRLNLKGYQGNCVTCWKKSDKKLYQIYNENPRAFEFMDRMERKYGLLGPEFAKYDNAKSRVFFRRHRSATDIMCEAESWRGSIRDDAKDYAYQLTINDGDSCDAFAADCENINNKDK